MDATVERRGHREPSRPGHGPPPEERPFACATCARASCLRGELAALPRTCPTRTHAEVARDAEPYAAPDTHATMVAADATPFHADGQLRNRVEELVAFAQARHLQRIGVAYCVSLTQESQRLGQRLAAAGLTPELVCCRVGAIDYDEIGLTKAHPERFAAICNPVGQARLLNERKVDLVVQVGLCLGHDLLLQRECDAPVTTLVVKDRALDHHPVQALR
jgi:uncharacterized metal-binding protein